MATITYSKRLFLPLALLFALAAILALALPNGTVGASQQEAQCGQGEVQAAFQALLVATANVDNMKGGLGAGASDCRYALWDDGATVVFSSSDFILGATANFIPLELLGVTVQEAKEILSNSEDRLFLGPVGTPADQLVEQELQETAFKHIIHPDFGHIVYQTKGFISHLEPGEYTSRYEWRWPILVGDDSLQVNTVTIQVTP